MINRWIRYEIPMSWEQRAMNIRANRDRVCGNIFTEAQSDQRWVGDLGEICFNDWLKQNGVLGFDWHADNAAGKPDFTLGGIRIDVKTVKRKVAPRPDYTAQITARHKDHPIDQLFFMCYQYQERCLWLLGGISMADFLAHVTYYGAGAQVHPNYTIRPGHEIYNAAIGSLTPPANWLAALRKGSIS